MLVVVQDVVSEDFVCERFKVVLSELSHFEYLKDFQDAEKHRYLLKFLRVSRKKLN